MYRSTYAIRKDKLVALKAWVEMQATNDALIGCRLGLDRTAAVPGGPFVSFEGPRNMKEMLNRTRLGITVVPESPPESPPGSPPGSPAGSPADSVAGESESASVAPNIEYTVEEHKNILPDALRKLATKLGPDEYIVFVFDVQTPVFYAVFWFASNAKCTIDVPYHPRSDLDAVLENYSAHHEGVRTNSGVVFHVAVKEGKSAPVDGAGVAMLESNLTQLLGDPRCLDSRQRPGVCAGSWEFSATDWYTVSADDCKFKLCDSVTINECYYVALYSSGNDATGANGADANVEPVGVANQQPTDFEALVREYCDHSNGDPKFAVYVQRDGWNVLVELATADGKEAFQFPWHQGGITGDLAGVAESDNPYFSDGAALVKCQMAAWVVGGDSGDRREHAWLPAPDVKSLGALAAYCRDKIRSEPVQPRVIYF